MFYRICPIRTARGLSLGFGCGSHKPISAIHLERGTVDCRIFSRQCRGFQLGLQLSRRGSAQQQRQRRKSEQESASDRAQTAPETRRRYAATAAASRVLLRYVTRTRRLEFTLEVLCVASVAKQRQSTLATKDKAHGTTKSIDSVQHLTKKRSKFPPNSRSLHDAVAHISCTD